jgi:hypothetical protein
MISIVPTGDVQPFRAAKAASLTPKSRKTLILRRILDSLSAWDQKQKDREIGRLLARSGGRFTDSLERRVMQCVMASDWSVHR